MIARGKALKKEGVPIESSGMRIAPAIATVDLKTPGGVKPALLFHEPAVADDQRLTRQAFVFAAAKKRVAAATSSIVVNSPSTVSRSITLWTTSSSEIPSAFAWSGICLSTRGVRT